MSIPPDLRLLDWLVREDLLIEDAPVPDGTIGEESVVRPAFERLGDFLIAQALLKGMVPEDLRAACKDGGRLASFVGSQEAVATNEGIVSALSLLVPEDVAPGVELPDLFDDGPLRSAVLRVTVSSYPWRDPSSFTHASDANLRRSLRMRGYSFEAMDSALAVCCQVSVIDAVWLDRLLRESPLAIRDAYWCDYLHQSYEASGPVRRLIAAAIDEIQQLDQIEEEVAERWIIALLWFTAAADRRVKDCATRASIAVLREHKKLVPRVLSRLIRADDDTVRERTLLAAYGACLLTKDHSVCDAACGSLAEYLDSHQGDFGNALLRDYARSIAELAQLLMVTGTAEKLLALLDALNSPWPLTIPTDDQIERWNALPKLAHSCLEDDFCRYSLYCLDKWGEAIPRRDMGKWILGRVADGLGYAGSGCESYDNRMLALHGGGRARRRWAERIGKKYQWIAMHQLAASLADHAIRRRDSWAPEPLRKPLSLLQKRELDPTLPRDIITEEEGKDTAWWLPVSLDLSHSASLSDDAWVARRDDVPGLSELLAPTQNGASNWLLLNGYPQWDSRPDDADYNVPYRNVWIQVRGYLVEPRWCKDAFYSLSCRNFFGRWMPEGASWLYGFVGEYPWGAAFNTEPEWYNARGGTTELSFSLIPVCSEVVAEWEYDASVSRNLHIPVPARAFFAAGDLWWNGADGFLNEKQETIFRAPGVTESGPAALIVSFPELLSRLKGIKKRLIWTLLLAAAPRRLAATLCAG